MLGVSFLVAAFVGIEATPNVATIDASAAAAKVVSPDNRTAAALSPSFPVAATGYKGMEERGKWRLGNSGTPTIKQQVSSLTYGQFHDLSGPILPGNGH